MSLRVVFMGTPAFAVAPLNALCDMGLDIVGVITQPDRPSGRGNKVECPQVKLAAIERGLPVYQFERLRRQAGLDLLRELKPDLCVTAAFGQILSQKLLDVPRLGTINVHASLLPRHRGSAPINYAIMMGEECTGVTTMLTDAGLDTGDMLMSESVKIGEYETAGELTERLSLLGAEVLKKTVTALINGELQRVKQDESLMTYEPLLTKEMGKIDWSKSAREINNLVRGVNPWPGAYTRMADGTLKIWAVRMTDISSNAPAGEVIRSGAKDGLFIACGENEAVEIVEMQAPNSKRMTARAYLAGKQIKIGTRLGE